MKLRPYQQESNHAIAKALAQGTNRVLSKMPTGCHARGQGILLFDGRVKAVEDVMVGDALMGPDNHPRLVLSLAQGEDEMVRIVPTKGDPWTVNIDHVLTLQRTRTQSRTRPYRNCLDGTLKDVAVREWLSWSKTQKHVYKLIRRGVEFATRPVPVDPYILGLLLGDGSLAVHFGFSNIDPEPLEAMRRYAAVNGLRLHQSEPPRQATYTFRSTVKYERSPLTVAMRSLGLLPIEGRDRFVPDLYKRNTRSVRLEILAGMMDSDGAATQGGYDYSTISRRLAQDAAFLARSVGLAAYVSLRRTRSQHGTHCVSWRVSISGDCAVVPCRVERKRVGTRRQIKDVLLTGFSVEAVGRDAYYGFSLTGDGRYLLDDFTVTHNTGKTVAFAALPSDLSGWLSQFPENHRKMLVIAHREELLDQAAKKIHQANPNLIVMVEQGDRRASVYADVVVASIQTLAAMHFRRLHRFLARTTFRVVVVDECFVPGTLVDGRPIETIAVGDEIDAFDPSTLEVVKRRVLRTISKKTGRLVVIRTCEGVIVCTPSHKLMTMTGWRYAGTFVVGDTIGHHATRTRHVSSVREVVHLKGAEPSVYVETERPDILLHKASRHMDLSTVVSQDGHDESEVRVGEDANEQSHEQTGRAGADEVNPSSDQAPTETQRRQRETTTSPAGASSEGAWMADRGGDPDGERLQATPLQDRHSERRFEGGRRSGRRESFSQGPEATGHEEGRISTWARVESVEILEPGSDGRFERLCPEGRVYDLEVEDVHTYFVNGGFAVSNCHHAAAPTYRTALAHLGFLPMADVTDKEGIEAATFEDVKEMATALAGWDVQAPKDRLLVGVTATPNRSDAIGLGCVFQTIAYSYNLRDAISDGWLVPIVPWAVETKTDLDAVKMNRGDFNQKDLAQAVNNEQRNRQALAAWELYAKDVPTIGFTVDVQHAHQAAELFRSAGHNFLPISGETPKDERRAMLQAFSARTAFRGELVMGFMNCMVLSEGTDLPVAGCIVHLKPTKSATLYEQMTGRGLRPHPQDPVGPERLTYTGPLLKDACIVIDLVDLARKHSLQNAPILYGLPPGLLVKGKKLEQAVEEFEDLMANQFKGADIESILQGKHMTLEQLGALASQVDIWNIPSLGAFGKDRLLTWTKISNAGYRIQYPWNDGTERVDVLQNLVGMWEISLTTRPHDGGPVRQRTLATQIETPELAAQQAETFIEMERRSVTKLKSKDAPWRNAPATPKQQAMMKRLVPAHLIPKNCTKGAASDLIDRAYARKG